VTLFLNKDSPILASLFRCSIIAPSSIFHCVIGQVQLIENDYHISSLWIFLPLKTVAFTKEKVEVQFIDSLPTEYSGRYVTQKGIIRRSIAKYLCSPCQMRRPCPSRETLIRAVIPPDDRKARINGMLLENCLAQADLSLWLFRFSQNNSQWVHPVLRSVQAIQI